MKYIATRQNRLKLFWATFGLLTGMNAAAAPLSLPDSPLFVAAVNEPPLILITMGRDHKLYYEAYNDASDLNDDGQLDIRYDPGIDYFGYFDSGKCYTYDATFAVTGQGSGRFEPSVVTANKKCSGATEWSGDFLNYITTARMDAIRGVLYGGSRMVDTDTDTVLERTFVPQDGHSWGKEYTSVAIDGYDISNFSPLALPGTGKRHLFANTTLLNVGSGEPRLRILNDTDFRVWEWLSIERPVADSDCGNPNKTNCVVGAASSDFSIVPSDAADGISSVTRTIYDIDANCGSCDQTPDNNSELNTTAAVGFGNGAEGSDTILTINDSTGDAFSQTNGYFTEILGTLNVSTSGTYTFGVDGDDALEFAIDTTGNGFQPSDVVASWYGGHGTSNNPSAHSGVVILAAGSYDFRYRHTEATGGAAYKLFWTPPSASGGSTPALTDFFVRVQACVTGLLESNCKLYPDGNYKPTGILHDFGENDRMKFGLLTGSYEKNLSGGVLRKKMGSITDEINADDGTFSTTIGIIQTIDRLKIVGFGGNFLHGSNCGFIFTRTVNEGECRLWGNPISEMMYEGLRYFSGKATPTSAFNISASGNDDATLGLPLATWDDPYDATTGANECAIPMQLVISDINPSYDTNSLPGVNSNFGSFTGDITGLNVETIANATITANEPDIAGSHFIGQVGSTFDGAPSPKTIVNLGNIRGLAPEEPTKQGGYYSSSIGYFGKTNDVNTATSEQNVTTLAVAIASPLPKFEIPVAGSIITLVPFAKSVGGAGISSTQGNFQPTNTIVDFYVESIVNTSAGNADVSVNGGLPYYKFRINFEDAEQGADHDMDAISEYVVTVDDNTLIGDISDDTLTVAMNSVYAAGGVIQHMGYVISGTTTDNIYLEVRDSDTGSGSDPDYFLDTPNTTDALPLSSTRVFIPGLSGGATLLNDPLWYAAKWGGFEDENDNDLPDLTSEWDANLDGTPDNYFLVTNAGKLKEQLEDTFDRITELVGASASSVAINSTVLQTTSRLYQARFNTADWSGELSAFTLTTEGEIDAEVWRASENIPAEANRNIFSMVDISGTLTKIEFLSTDTDLADAVGDGAVSVANQANDNSALGAVFVDYIRGDQTNEIQNGGIFRDRSNLLADIVNASPISVGISNFAYDVLPGDEGSTYGAYLSSVKGVNYSDVYGSDSGNSFTVVFAGSNDGMVHAFQDTVDIDDDNAVTLTDNPGREIFSYIPSVLLEGLNELASPNYAHKFFVDASPNSSDVYFDDSDSATNDWRTMLVGALGNGGKSIYALDITDPLAFDETKIMWEYNVTDPSATDNNDNSEEMGNILFQPQIVRLNNGKWGVVFGNGYNSNSQTARLFILDAETGAEIKVIDTGVGDTGTPNGLAMPFLLDENGDRIVDVVYAGDLYGKMWKFDLSATNSNSWGFSNNFKAGSTPKPLFTTEDSSGVAQPITTRPTVVTHPDGGFVILFGTGKYLETGDNIIPASPQVQSFYGIWDDDDQVVPDSGDDRDDILQQQEVVAEVDITNDGPDNIAGNADDVVLNTTRVVTENAVAYPSKKGWYIDLLRPSPATGEGEMVISNPLTRFSRIIWTSFIPPSDPCSEGGGSAVLMELDAVSGTRLENSVFDLNDDGIIDADDFVLYSGDDVPGSGIYIPATLASPAVISAADASQEYKLTSGISGDVTTTQESTGGTTVGRQSWRQLR